MQFKYPKARLNKNNISMVMATILVLSCPQTSSAKPIESTENDVKNCQYLKDIEGKSGYGKDYNWKANAKYFALKKAEEIGASHVVWKKFESVGAFNGVATAKTFQCNS